jgi:hypothetical protein
VRIYILRDTDPQGGYFAAQSFLPSSDEERRSVVEVRSTEVSEEFWDGVLTGNLPIDEDRSNDSTWESLWDEAEPVWSKGA